MDTPQQQPTYPQTNIEVQPQGVLVIVTLAPGTQLIQIIPEETMNAIAGKWLETRKQIKRELAIVQDIKKK